MFLSAKEKHYVDQTRSSWNALRVRNHDVRDEPIS